MCAACTYRTKDKSNMKRHVEKYHMEHSFTCQTCGVAFLARSELKMHYMKKHNLSETVAFAAANDS